MGAITAISMAAGSGILLFACFPPVNLPVLAWVALVPLFVAIGDKSIVQGFFLSFLSGIVFFLGIFNWILEISGYIWIHHTMLALYLGSYFAIFGLVFAFISQRQGSATALFSAPFVWVALEYARSNFSFLALPWSLLAHSQYQYPTLIQVASVTGTYGVSFLIVMINSGIAVLILHWTHRFQHRKSNFIPPISKQGSVALVLTALILLSLTLLYGHMIVSRPIAGDEIRLSLVQGNIEQSKKWDRRYADAIMETYSHMTQAAAKGKPDLIVWPETAVPGFIDKNTILYKEVNRIALEAQSFLLLGSSQYRKFINKRSGRKYFNSAFLIHSDGEMQKKQQYDKIRLLPFGEYTPFKRAIPWSYIKVPNLGGFTPGKEFTIFELPSCCFGVTICWENIFSNLFRQFVKQGAQFMVNITNEAWFGKTAAPYQFVSMSVFRAAENRVFVVRCANTGVSCFIDPYGRIVSRVMDKNGSDIFVRGVLSGSVIPLESNTFYTRYGNWLVWMCTVFSVVVILVALFKGIRGSEVLGSIRHKNRRTRVQRFKGSGFRGSRFRG